jgi:murein DD-endopeptidase MepM/ murein hydrolase activator NlpD
MISPPRRDIRPAIVAIAICPLLLAVTLLDSTSPAARAAEAAQLHQRIGAQRSRVSALSGVARAAGQQVHGLGVAIGELQRQIASSQSDLDAKRTQLIGLEIECNAARAKLQRLQGAERQVQSVLAEQLVGSYEADQPDLVSVVLESTGFSDLLERLAFAQRISDQDAQIAGQVRASRRAVAAQATRLGALTERQQTLTDQTLYQRNGIARARVSLLTQQLTAAKLRNATAGQLATARGQVASLAQQLMRLQTTPSQSSARGASPASHTSGQVPRQASKSGGFSFPLPRSAAAPPATWSLDDGVDISAPGGTPEYAVCSGTIVLHGIGGYGPSAPVLHCDRPLDRYDYVYYGHAGPGNWTPVGTHVSAGQVISEVGYGIVGISTGPHIEIGFADSSGSPIGPASAPQMMSLLRAAYAA